MSSVESAVAAFGAAAGKKLSSLSAKGEPEDQLRNPLEVLFADLAELCGMARGKLTLVGESSLSDLKTRPDFAVSYANALVGFVEVKAPGKGADSRKFKEVHDKEQWKKLSSLPNLLYTDGNSFALWRSGELVGKVHHLDGDVETSGAKLRPGAGLLGMVEDFLQWEPLPPKTPKHLAETSARLCRLLREEVTEQLARRDSALTDLAEDWRHLLFPDATDDEFADGYAQAVTFGLLLARARGIDLDKGIDAAAKELGKNHSLIGRALRVLTDKAVQDDALTTSVATLTRVLAVVDWPTIAKGDPEVWLYFYETFLAEYDAQLRQRTGSYYTPVEVVEAMTGLVDEAVRERFDLPAGLADEIVTLVDPAMGTGTFLLSALRRIASYIADDLGEGAVPAAITAALRKLIGFELQLGPFAVAQLRVLAELAELGVETPGQDALRLFVTNTLDNPFVEDEKLGSWYEPIARSRREANQIKKGEPVFAVIGNPPYKAKSRDQGAWIVAGDSNAPGHPPLHGFIPPPEWGVGAHVKHLYNPYVYFWRWALWKVFDHHSDNDRGIICLITMAGFLDGPGFQQMRAYLRRRADAIWVIDCSPEGHQPPVSTRIFQGVQQPVCIMLAVRDGSTSPDEPAPVRFRSLSKGPRTAKFAELVELRLSDETWEPCPADWRAPFLPESEKRWRSFPSLDDLLRWSGSGVMPGRTWVIAPDAETLRRRWRELIDAKPDRKAALLSEHPRDRRVDTVLADGLPGYRATQIPIGQETGDCPAPARIGYRSFDRQWIVPDKRVINQPNPTLWTVRSERQVYLTAPHTTVPSSGPAVTFSAFIPDLDHYKGSFGGRAYPLWLDSNAGQGNSSARHTSPSSPGRVWGRRCASSASGSTSRSDSCAGRSSGNGRGSSVDASRGG